MKENTYGEFLRKRRQECGLSQYQLGMCLNVSDRAVSKWENGLARPKSQLLYKLSAILGVTVEELLRGGGYPERKRKSCVTKERHDSLWDKAWDKLMERYAGMPPVETVSRFETEKLALMNTDMILFFDLISRISESAVEKGYPICRNGGIGASFVAYLLGASDVNPLPAHYYCPVCRKAEFVPQVSDGWEMDRKDCGDCHSSLIRDGHAIPFEIYRHVIGRNTGFDLVVSKYFYEEAEQMILQYFDDYRVVILNPPKEITANRNAAQMTTYVIQPRDMQREAEKDSMNCSYEKYCMFISDNPYIHLILKDDYEKYMELRRLVKIPEAEIDFLDSQVRQAVVKGDLNGIPKAGLDSLPLLFNKFTVSNLRDVLQLYGIALCVAALPGYEAESYLDKLSDLWDAVPYRDDVFLHICSKMEEHGYRETGFPFRIMDHTRKGFYCHNGVDRHIRKLLLDIGVSERYIACLEETPYLFPKAQGIIQFRYTMIFLWYRIHYLEEFQHVIGENMDGSDTGLYDIGRENQLNEKQRSGKQGIKR